MSNINIEFFADTTGTVYVQTADGSCRIVTERDRELISDVIKRISEIHPKTYDALMKQYAKSNRNKWFQEFLAFQRFVRCNWGNHDRSTQDVGATGAFHYEYVSCPMRFQFHKVQLKGPMRTQPTSLPCCFNSIRYN